MRQFIKTNGKFDFYLLKGKGIWFIEAFHTGTLDHDTKTLAGVSTKAQALRIVDKWAKDFV